MNINSPADAARIIKTQRVLLGYTQQEVADAVGIARPTLARIERADGGGAFATYLRLFEHLGISLGASTDEEEHSPAPQSSSALTLFPNLPASYEVAARNVLAKAADIFAHVEVPTVKNVDFSSLGVDAIPTEHLWKAIQPRDPDQKEEP